LVVLVWITTNAVLAQQIKGIVVDQDGPLPGVNVRIDTLKQGTATDLDGNFSLQTGVEGTFSVKISYVGYKDKIIHLNILSGINDLGIIELEMNNLILGEVVVVGTMAPSQAKAYSIKKNSIAMLDVVASDAVGKLPDRNAAEAVQRIQGVAVARYHGEADQATVRGTPFAWTSTLFNGNRLPSSNVRGNRSSVLDAVPSELIQYVQVAKAITPDWEGDAIGGSVNFITRTAPLNRKLGISLAGGYNDFSENGTYNGSVVYGDRFFNDRLGIIVVGAIWDRKWGSDSYDVSYNTSLGDDIQRKSINNVMLKRYMGKRQTYGINTGIEYKFNNQHKIYFRGLYDKFNDIRPVYESYIDYSKSRYQYNYRYSYYQTRLAGGELGGEHQLSRILSFDWAASDYTSEYFLNTPPDAETKGLPIATFRQDIKSGFNNLSSDGYRYWGFDSPNGIGGNPLDFNAGINDAGEVMDPEKLTLQQLVISQLDNKEHDRTAQVNFKLEPSSKIKLKAGGKFRTKKRNSNFGYNAVYLPGAALGIPGAPPLLTLSELQRENFPRGHGYFKEMKGNYDQYIINPLTKQQLFDLYKPEVLEANGFVDYTPASGITSIYEATENAYAAYFMADVELLENLRLIGGLRNEYTTTDLRGSAAITTPEGTRITPVKTENNYNALLPMIHLKYSLSEKSNLRAAYTRTFVRPDFGDMTPGESVNTTGGIIVITKGNPDLKPTFANNFDLMGEYFFDNVGLFSGGFFYKDISNVIFSDVSYYNENGESYMLTQAKNLQDARVFGFEIGVNKRFDFLNGFWSGFGAELNYTYIDSKVKVPRQIGAGSDDYTVEDKSTLPDQSKNMANAILFYEKGRVMIRIAGNYRGKSVFNINQSLGPDYYVWTAKNFTLDASATVDLMKNVKVFVELNNLTNEPLKQYMGDSRRLTSVEWYGMKGQIGFRWDIFK
jgi:TonB-dependent receptor